MKEFLLIIGLLIAIPSYSQENGEGDVDDFLDDFLAEETEVLEGFIRSLQDFRLLFVSANYSSDTYFAGRDIGIEQYNIATQLSYIDYKGFSAGVTGILYENFDPQWDVTIASFGFGKGIGKKKTFNYQTGYSRYFFSNPKDSPFRNAFDVGLGVRNKKRNLGLQVSGTLLTGDDTVFQLISRAYTNLRLYKAKELSVALRPQLRFIVGQQTLELSRTVAIRGMEFEEFYEETVFDLLNTQLGLPLQAYRGNWSFETEININFPRPIGEEPDIDNTIFFNVTLAYLINL